MYKTARIIGLAMTLAMCSLHLQGSAHADGISLYVANEGNGTVRQFSESGTDLGNFVSGLIAPANVSVDRSGNVFVSDFGGQSIQEYSPQGNLLLTISTSFSPGQVQVAANGNLLVNNYYGGDVLQYSPTGQYLGVFCNPGLARAYYSALDSQGNLYITDHGDGGLVRKISPSGIDEGNFISGVGFVAGIAYNSTGDLYVAIDGSLSGGKDKIVEYSATGTYLGLITETGLGLPEGIALGPDGNLYVANYGNNTIQDFSPSGANLGVFANTGLDGPTGIAFGASVPEPSSAVLLIMAGVTIPTYLILRRRSRWTPSPNPNQA
jgi:hypothetical protein